MSEEDREIVDVWAHNLEEELRNMMEVVEEFPYVAVDTEFPGIVVRPVGGSFKSTSEYHYQTLKSNVDMLKVIQVGLSFSDARGNRPKGVSTWQFNFKFSLATDVFAHESIDILTKSGIDFDELEKKGIDSREFSEAFTVAGVALNDSICWISFHGGYDFAYLLRVLANQDLPEEESEFFSLLGIFFPRMYDIKQMMLCCDPLHGSLQNVANILEISRVGKQHCAGSDALLTLKVFFAMRKKYFGNKIDDERFNRILYGLGDYTGRKLK